jgi:hypothetical protein
MSLFRKKKALPVIGEMVPDTPNDNLTEHFGYDDVQEMCQDIAATTILRIGTVDVILWRYMNLVGKDVKWN